MGQDRQALEDFKILADNRFIQNESGIITLHPLVDTNYHETKVLFITQQLVYETILFLDFEVLAQSHSTDSAVWMCRYAFAGNITGLFQVGTPKNEKMGAYTDADVVVTAEKSDPEISYPDIVQVAVLGDTDDESIRWSYHIHRILRLHWEAIE